MTKNIDSKREYARLVKHTIDWQLLYKRLGYPRYKWFMEIMVNIKIEVTKEEEERISKIHQKCDTYIQAKSVKN
jgi:hypothetical protein